MNAWQKACRRSTGGGALAALACAALATLMPSTARAWIWPEHRDIAAAAVDDLPAAPRRTLDAMWAEARTLGGKQVCEKLVDPGEIGRAHV